MKALILSGGRATRLRPITYTSAKQLVPVANKPVLFHAIESVVAAGITDIGIVVGHTKDEVKAAVGDGSRWQAKVTYIEQPEPLGLAHAVLISEEFVADDRFVLFLGDNFLKGGIKSFVDDFASQQQNALIILTKVPNPSEMGVAVIDGNNRIVRLVEKPKDPPSDLGIVGIYLFDKNVFEAARAIKPSWRNELEITDAIQWLIDRKLDVRAQVITDRWIDTGKKDDMLDVNRVVLAEIERRIDGSVSADSEITGNVVIEAGAEVVDSTIRGPAIIGEHSRVVRSYVGPFTSIYHHVTIEDSEIENSIVLEHTEISNASGRIDASLIGRYVGIRHSRKRPTAYTLMLGDHSQIELA
jgi:glucose-1-phosphate thymidylyltransferase